MHNQERIDYLSNTQKCRRLYEVNTCNELLIAFRGCGEREGDYGWVEVFWGRIEIIIASFFIHIL